MKGCCGVILLPGTRSLGRSANLTQVNNLIVNSRLTTGALPLDYFHIPIPEGFATTNPNAFDITTLQGLKLYRLRQAYDTNFGALNAGFSQPLHPVRDQDLFRKRYHRLARWRFMFVAKRSLGAGMTCHPPCAVGFRSLLNCARSKVM